MGILYFSTEEIIVNTHTIFCTELTFNSKDPSVLVVLLLSQFFF